MYNKSQCMSTVYMMFFEDCILFNYPNKLIFRTTPSSTKTVKFCMRGRFCSRNLLEIMIQVQILSPDSTEYQKKIKIKIKKVFTEIEGFLFPKSSDGLYRNLGLYSAEIWDLFVLQALFLLFIQR